MNIRLVVRALSAALLLFTLACASDRHPEDSVQVAAPSRVAPEVTLLQLTRAANLGLHVEGGVPVHYRLSIVNPFDYAVRLTSVEVESVGDLGAYSLKRVRHAFDLTIPAKTSKAIEFRAWVRPLYPDMLGENSSPVLLRGSAIFEGESGKVRRNFAARGQ